MDIAEERQSMKGPLVTARCAGCAAITKQWIPGELPRIVCGKDETIATCRGPFLTFVALFDSDIEEVR